MTGNKKDGDYEVGYGKPPKEHQFQKGVSGNGKGRPPRKRIRFEEDISGALMNVANEKIQINIGSQSKWVPYLEAIMMSMRNKALKGDHRAQKYFLDKAEKAGRQEKIHFEEIQQAMHDLERSLNKYTEEEFLETFGIPKLLATEMYIRLSKDLDDRFPET